MAFFGLIQLRYMILFFAGIAVFSGLIFRAVFGKAKAGPDTPTGVSLIEIEEIKNNLTIGLFITSALCYHFKWFPSPVIASHYSLIVTLLYAQFIEVRYYQRVRMTLQDGCPQCQYLECTTKPGGCFFLTIHHYVSTIAAFLGLMEIILTTLIDCCPGSEKLPGLTNTMELTLPVAPLTLRRNAVEIDHPQETPH